MPVGSGGDERQGAAILGDQQMSLGAVFSRSVGFGPSAKYQPPAQPGNSPKQIFSGGKQVFFGTVCYATM